MEIFHIISLVLIGLLAVFPLILICKLKRQFKKWEERNLDNILSKKIVFENQKEDDTKPLTEMINYHKNNEIVRYVIK